MEQHPVPVQPSGPLSPADVANQVAVIRQIMGELMTAGEHYGTIPGCGDKPGLLQPGAQLISLMFHLGQKFRVQQTDHEGGHREYYVETDVFDQRTGVVLGMGVGIATTMESKWRFRSGPVEFTGQAVPRDYWDLRKTDPAKALELIGGRGYQTRKNPDTKGWEVVAQGERVEHDNPADYYNTALKIGSKRSFVHAIMNTTAAGEMFTSGEDDDHDDQERVNAETLATLRALRDQLRVAPNTYAQQVAHYGVQVDSSLPQTAAEHLIQAYHQKREAHS